MDEILVDDVDDVRWLTLNRPTVHNAQNTAMLEALLAVLEDTHRRDDLRALVLRGAGPSFSSGHDLRESAVNPAFAEAIRTADGRRRWERRLFVRPVELLEDLPIPTVCAVQGHCLGAGVMFAAAADLVVAADDAVFGSPVVTALAVNDAEVPSFAWELGVRRAKQALWFDERLDAAEAHRIGFVNWVVPADRLTATVEDVVRRLLAVPAETLALSKATFAFMQDRLGRRDTARYHFVNHVLSHQTEPAQAAAAARRAGRAG
ncbi:enoyl-CoA hydratase-related protein [Micromonospora cathayae]|uniref:Enoyl-CoA hydratase-related protein n=1 Tax=Micromonospora cathayae TaxID=3028804 RepID=A0ABY7ZM19_9ACTN|nr:enoyl-CoA hydratase-related protein [Micromonospora sp. HUAS 3]WDZ83806.1 enoyl-CoA hydratase-related protein [Micromonospora sp. HUAS 3]